MKKLIIVVFLATAFNGFVYSQEYKVSKSTGRLEIREVNHVTIEGHNGNEIVFTSTSHGGDKDERAKGLRVLSSLGLEDNTGIGLSVVEKGDVVEVHQLKSTEGPKIKTPVPKGVVVSYTHSSPYGDEIRISNFEGRIEISTVHSGVELNNASGPLVIKTVHGDIDATFGAAIKAPITIESAHGHVDLALPPATAANLTLNTNWGEVLVDPSFKIELQKRGDLVHYSGKISGKLNGGGTEITLTSQHNNVYLRTK
jgi:hypothetical protein